MLSRKGTLDFVSSPSSWINNSIARMDLKEAPLTFRIAERAGQLDWEHQDPADRFMVATAIENELSLATADELILRFPGVSLA